MRAKIAVELLARTFDPGHYLFLEVHKFSSRKTVRLSEQIMSKYKYLSMFFKCNGGYCAYYGSNLFHKTREFSKIEEFHSIFPQF